jgi:hypothetical protein
MALIDELAEIDSIILIYYLSTFTQLSSLGNETDTALFDDIIIWLARKL